MAETNDIAAPVPAPQGAALAHARGLSATMGAFSGGVVGAIFGAVWGMAGRSSVAVRTAALAAVGAIAGLVLSGRTWNNPPRNHAQTPARDTDFLAEPAADAPAAAEPQHAARIVAERNVQAEVSQAL